MISPNFSQFLQGGRGTRVWYCGGRGRQDSSRFSLWCMYTLNYDQILAFTILLIYIVCYCTLTLCNSFCIYYSIFWIWCLAYNQYYLEFNLNDENTKSFFQPKLKWKKNLGYIVGDLKLRMWLVQVGNFVISRAVRNSLNGQNKNFLNLFLLKYSLLTMLYSFLL